MGLLVGVLVGVAVDGLSVGLCVGDTVGDESVAMVWTHLRNSGGLTIPRPRSRLLLSGVAVFSKQPFNSAEVAEGFKHFPKARTPDT